MEEQATKKPLLQNEDQNQKLQKPKQYMEISQGSNKNSNNSKQNLQEQKKQEIFEEQEQVAKEFRNKFNKKFLFVFGILAFSIQFYNCNVQGLLKKSIMEVTGIDEIQFQLFLTIQGVLGIPFAFIGGITLDKMGYSLGYIVYNAVIVIGTWTMVIGGYQESFNWLLIGVTINAIGLQIAVGAANSLLSKWYKDPELTSFNGYYQGTLKLSIVVTSMVYPSLNEYFGNIFYPILVGALVCTIAYGMSLTAPIMDLQCEKQINKVSKIRPSGFNMGFHLSDFKQFSKDFWILILSFVLNFLVCTMFSANINTLLFKKFKTNQEENGIYISIANFIGLISPVLGYLLQKCRCTDFFLVIGSFIGMLQYIYLLMYPECQESCFYEVLPAIIFFGLFLAIFTLIQIPQVAITSPPHLIGTAYGIAWGLKQFVEAVIPILSIGPLLNSYDVEYSLIFLLAVSMAGFVVTLIIYFRKQRLIRKLSRQEHSIILQQERKERHWQQEQQQHEQQEQSKNNQENL